MVTIKSPQYMKDAYVDSLVSPRLPNEGSLRNCKRELCRIEPSILSDSTVELLMALRGYLLGRVVLGLEFSTNQKTNLILNFFLISQLYLLYFFFIFFLFSIWDSNILDAFHIYYYF